MKSLVYPIVCLWIWAGLVPLKANPFLVILAPSPPSAGATYTLQDQLTGASTGTYNPGQSGFNADAYAVEFTPATSYTITRVDLPVAQVGTPAQTYTCEIFTQSGSLPSTLVGSASASVAGNLLPASEADYSFYPTAAVTSGTPYYIVLRASGVHASNYVAWHRVTTAGRIDVFNAAGPAWTNATTTRRVKYKTYSSP